MLAWRLAQAGVRVVIIERGRLGAEASSAAGGMLAPLAEADQQDAFLDLGVSSRRLYRDLATELNAITGIEIEYRTEGTLFLALNGEDEMELDQRFAWQRATGLRIEGLDASSVRAVEPHLSSRARWALKFPDDHQVNNRQLLVALEKACQAAGVAVLEETEAVSLVVDRSRISGVVSSRGEIRAGAVVLAAGCWSGLISPDTAIAAASIEPVRGQMIAFRSPDPPVKSVIYSNRGYLIPRLGGFLIAGSTSERAGYEKAVTAGGLASILANAFEIMPSLKDSTIIETWSGLRPATADGLPVIGPDPEVEGLFYATGHFRNGILLAPITAEVMRDLILDGAAKRDLTAFSVTRFGERLAAG